MDAFAQYLAERRDYKTVVPAANPAYADELVAELLKHLKTVSAWIDGKIDRRKMAEAMEFFRGQYAAKGWIYRGGVIGEDFDSEPRSYSRKRALAEGFAVASAQKHPGKEYFVIKRKASRKSLDFSKLLKEYATGKHYRADEAEVVEYSTPVSQRNVIMYEAAN